jgi:LEA14-like dessication related protein
MGKKYWYVLLILLICCLVIWLWWRSPSSSIKKEAAKFQPQVGVTAVKIYDIDDDRINMQMAIVLNNPLPVALNASRLKYKIFIDSVKVIESIYSKPININSSDTASIELPMEILVKPMKKILERLDRKKIDSAIYTMQSTMEVDVPIAGERSFDMNISRRLPAIHIPKGSLEKIQIDKLGLKETTLNVVLKIENPNVFPLKLDDGRYNVSIDKDFDMDGYFEKHLDIPAKQTVPLNMHLVLKTVKTGKLAWKSLFDKKDTHFKVKFSGKLNAQNKMLDNSKFLLTLKGTLDELKK